MRVVATGQNCFAMMGIVTFSFACVLLGIAAGADVFADIQHKNKVYRVPTGLFINNSFVPSLSERMFPAVNPADGQEYMLFFEGDREDVDRAVGAAKAAFPVWMKMSSTMRGKLLYKLADLIERDIESLSELESLGNGKPVSVCAQNDLPNCCACLRYFAGWADKNHGQLVDASPDFHTFTRHEPFGVVGAIIPWNYPLEMMIWKIAPAIAAGNTIVIKTSEKTPMTALIMAELIVEAGFPAGVINVISGYGPTAGDALARHPDVGKIAFTGSTATGRVIAATAALTVKSVSLELGGKSAHIVFPDADIDAAVAAGSNGIFSNSGQVCCAGSRLFVHEDIYDEFLGKLKTIVGEAELRHLSLSHHVVVQADTMVVGDPFDEATDLGPLIDRSQYEKVLSYIELALEEGATVLTGESTAIEEGGYFVPPTIITDVADSMRIVKEEVFGPVVCVLKFSSLDEVIARANDSPYGLAAGVHTKDINTAMRCSTLLEAGTVWINCYDVGFFGMPFGGFKQSGIGRDGGQYALMEYTQVKSVIMQLHGSSH